LAEILATELIGRLTGFPQYDRFSEAYPWFHSRGVDGVAELLKAADSASPAERSVVMDAVYGHENIEPIWKAASEYPNVGPHARLVLGIEASRWRRSSTRRTT
jgi:hypothetical protein